MEAEEIGTRLDAALDRKLPLWVIRVGSGMSAHDVAYSDLLRDQKRRKVSSTESLLTDSSSPRRLSNSAGRLPYSESKSRRIESATSHDNIVELRYVANDSAIISRTADQTRLAKTSYYCNEARISYLKQGVVMREIVATSDNSDHIEFTFDISTCDRLPKPKQADSKTLAEFALTAARTENAELGKPSNSWFRLDRATAHQGVVDVRFIVFDASAAASAQASRNIRGILTGYFCGKYRDFISQGLVFHHFFVWPDGSPVIDFTIDRSNC